MCVGENMRLLTRLYSFCWLLQRHLKAIDNYTHASRQVVQSNDCNWALTSSTAGLRAQHATKQSPTIYTMLLLPSVYPALLVHLLSSPFYTDHWIWIITYRNYYCLDPALYHERVFPSVVQVFVALTVTIIISKIPPQEVGGLYSVVVQLHLQDGD